MVLSHGVIVGFFSGINRSAAEANAFLKERNHTFTPTAMGLLFLIGGGWRRQEIMGASHPSLSYFLKDVRHVVAIKFKK